MQTCHLKKKKKKKKILFNTRKLTLIKISYEHNRQKAMEDLQGGQTAVSCQMCEKSNQIKWKCINCDNLLCTNCYHLYRKVKSLDEHQIVDIKDVASHGK